MSGAAETFAPEQKGNGLVCFTNCLLPQENGKLVERDLWVDEQRGVILDAQVRDTFAQTYNAS